MVCRNKDKAEEARADIVKETGNKVQYDSLLNRHRQKNTGTDSLQIVWFFRRDIIHSSKWLVSLQEVYVHILDLSETKKVWEFAEAFKKKYKALNVLVSYLFSYLETYGNMIIILLLFTPSGLTFGFVFAPTSLFLSYSFLPCVVIYADQ